MRTNSSKVSDANPSPATIPSARTFSNGMIAMITNGTRSHRSEISIGRSRDTNVVTIASSVSWSRGYSSKKNRVRNWTE